MIIARPCLAHSVMFHGETLGITNELRLILGKEEEEGSRQHFIPLYLPRIYQIVYILQFELKQLQQGERSVSKFLKVKKSDPHYMCKILVPREAFPNGVK